MPLDTPIGFLTTDDPDASRTFYEQTLGLAFVADEPFALVFRSGDTMLRIQKMESVSPPPHTVFGWEIADIDATVSDLTESGALFERYPNVDQDERGIWTSPSGARVAWFRDPCGNLLSLTQPPAGH